MVGFIYHYYVLKKWEGFRQKILDTNLIYIYYFMKSNLGGFVMSKTDEEIKAELQKMLDESDDPEELISQWIDEVYGSNTQLKEYR